MHDKIIVGITQRIDEIIPYSEWRDAHDQRLIKWVVDIGFIPVPIPNNLVDIDLPMHKQIALSNWIEELNIGAILLSGGNNVGSVPHRDLTENFLLLWAEENCKPVLGICRGMQMIGVYSGVELINIMDHVNTTHNLQIIDTSTKIVLNLVNSYHEQALKNCPLSFKVLARSEDGSIEAIKHKKLPWEGWMWHPEREEKFQKYNQDRFKELILDDK